MMNDGTNYKGGDLILYNDETITAKKTVGNVLCYDSDIPHEVTEVTYGTRISCLILLSTKDFKLSIL
jgi:predicted 2-oxoglutarate/Fe(II)-dependent dioxygenase YbiX